METAATPSIAESISAEHETLHEELARLDALLANGDDGIHAAEFLARFVSFVRLHFDDEQSAMSRLPNGVGLESALEAHRQSHEALLEKIALAVEGDDSIISQLREVRSTIKQWIGIHLETHDKLLLSCLLACDTSK